jgi:hypothetical protein
MAAAKSAAAKLFAQAEQQGKRIKKITFCLSETTRGSPKKSYDYVGNKQKLEKPTKSGNKYKIIVSKAAHNKKSVRENKKTKGGAITQNKIDTILEETPKMYEKIIADIIKHKTNISLSNRKKNYILITDIGRDIDDTLALLALLYYHKIEQINLVAIFVSGFEIGKRAKLVLYWLSIYKIYNIPIILSKDYIDQTNDKTSPTVIKNQQKCILPENCDAIISSFIAAIDHNANDFKNKTSNEFYLSLLSNILNNSTIDEINYNLYMNKINKLFVSNTNNVEKISILGIGPLRPLIEEILLSIKDKIENIFIQGSGKINNKLLVPDLEAYNLKLDGFGTLFSENVFVLYQDKNFYFLGKATAYLFKFNAEDFKEIDNILNLKNINSLANQAIEGIIHFIKTGSPGFKAVFGRDCKLIQKNGINVNSKCDIKKGFEKEFYLYIYCMNNLTDNDQNNINVLITDLILFTDKFNNTLKNIADIRNKYTNLTIENNNKINKNLEKNISDPVVLKHITMLKSRQIMIEILKELNLFNTINSNIKDELSKMEKRGDNIKDDMLNTLEKYSNAYDLLLVYLALFPEAFNEKYENSEKNTMYKKYIQYNIEDENVLTTTIQNTKNNIMDIVKLSLSYIPPETVIDPKKTHFENYFNEYDNKFTEYKQKFIVL